MKITARQYAETLLTLTEGKSGNGLESTMKEFVEVLNDRHEKSMWRAIVRAFDNAWRRKYGASSVSVTTAYKPTQTLLDEVIKAFPHATITNKVDDKLMGGMVLQVDDRLFDGSVSGQLNQMFKRD